MCDAFGEGERRQFHLVASQELHIPQLNFRWHRFLSLPREFLVTAPVYSNSDAMERIPLVGRSTWIGEHYQLFDSVHNTH